MHFSVIVLLFIVSVTASGGAGFMYKKITALHETGSDIPTVLFFAPMPLVVLFAVLATVQGWAFTTVNVLSGIAGGICFAAAVAMLLTAVTKGDYSVSVIIINLSFVIPIIFSAVVLKEPVAPLQIAGIVILMFVIVFANISWKRRAAADGTRGESFAQAKEQTAETFSGSAGKQVGETVPKSETVLSESAAGTGALRTTAATRPAGRGNAWIAYALLACLFNGSVNTSLKVQEYYASAGENTFYFVMYVTALVIGLAVYMAVPSARVKRSHPRRIPTAAMCLGAFVAFNYYPLSLIAPYVNASMLFGISTSGAIFASLLAGWIFFREKVTIKSAVSLLCCASVIVLQIVSV